MTIANKVKSLTARLTMSNEDVRSLLEKDHDEAKDLLAKIAAATQGNRRLSLFSQLKIALTAHSRAEESAVYQPMLTAKSSESRDLANEGYVEHGIIDRLLAELASGDPGSTRWMATAKVLKEILEHHIDEEQADIFAELGEHFDADQLRLMGTAFLRAKAAVLKTKVTPRRTRKVSRKAPRRTAAPAPVGKLARGSARPRIRMSKVARNSSGIRKRG